MITMTGRLIIAIVSTLLEEAGIVAIILWGLPQINVYIPLWGLIIIMLAWAAIAIFVYRKGTIALLRKPVLGLPAMTGSKGKAVSLLAPNGTVRIKGETWGAESVRGKIHPGDEVTVVGQDGLKLTVRKSSKKKGE